MTLNFPAGPVVIKTRPTREQLQDSALSWLGLAQLQANGLASWVDHPEGRAVLRELKSKLAIIRRTLEEADECPQR